MNRGAERTVGIVGVGHKSMMNELRERLAGAAEQHNVPGAAIGIFIDREEHYAVSGVTNIQNPLPVDQDTTFQIGSTGKTLTATAIMRLVEQGVIDLGERVRTYVPELKLSDEHVAREVNVLQLLNHTAGWQGDFFEDTGAGDDALERYVDQMADLIQEFPLGKSFSYNNAAVCLAGRVIEKVTGKTYEQAVKELIFDPIGLEHSFFFPNEIMTRRFSVAHNNHPDGSIKVVDHWGEPRSTNAAGANISMSMKDLITWARFHLSGGTSGDGKQVLSEKLVQQMQEPTVETRGALGDYVGVTWILKDMDGTRLVSHDGSSNGVYCELTFVPERDFAVAMLVNSGPGGPALQNELQRWILETYVGVAEEDEQPLDLSDEELAPYVGTFETLVGSLKVTSKSGGLNLDIELKPETISDLVKAGEEPPDLPTFQLKILSDDRYVVVSEAQKGMKGFFPRSGSGLIEGIHFGGRLATRR